MSGNGTVQKLCGVCGDLAKGSHYGHYSCVSCGEFFRRMLQRPKNCPLFTCSKGGQCHIVRATRRFCTACRFHKCMAQGMRPESVKRRNLFKRDQVTKVSPPVPGQQQQQDEEEANDLGWDEDFDIMILMNSYHQASLQVTFREPFREPYEPGNFMDMLQFFTTLLRRIVYFYEGQRDFQNLSLSDQKQLLCGSALPICILRSAVNYNHKDHQWDRRLVDANGQPVIALVNVHGVQESLFQMHMRFIMEIQELVEDETIVLLLSQIILYSPSLTVRGQIEQINEVDRIREKYQNLFHRFLVQHHESTDQGDNYYGAFMDKIRGLSALCDTQLRLGFRLREPEVIEVRNLIPAVVIKELEEP